MTTLTLEKRLLFTFLTLYSFEKEVRFWSLENFKDNPPRLYRLQMIDSLMEALDIKSSYLEFTEGKFIAEIQLNKWGDFKKSIEKILPKEDEASRPMFEIKVNHIMANFRLLMYYRMNAERLISSTSGIYAASGEFRTFVKLMNNTSRKLYKELKKIDTILLFCINPNNIYYSEEELVNNFNFPDVNIIDVDMEWI
jgi:hypothetical protein